MSPTDPLISALRDRSEPDDAALTRVERRVRSSLHIQRAHRLRPAWLAVTVATAASALILIYRSPSPIDLNIETSTTTAIPLARDVALEAAGRGHATGDERAPRLRWDEGTLGVEVTPNRGVDLEITTDEAIIRVIGTGFSVDRGALGTAVAVRHGRVSVDCIAGGSSILTQGQSVECAPTRPSGLLARARAQAARGDAPDVVLATLSQADRPDDPPALAGEIVALQVDVLRNAGRDDEALAAARRYLDAGYTPRRPEIRRIASAILYAHGGCSEALPLLRQAVSEGGDAEDAQALSACEAVNSHP